MTMPSTKRERLLFVRVDWSHCRFLSVSYGLNEENGNGKDGMKTNDTNRSDDRCRQTSWTCSWSLFRWRYSTSVATEIQLALRFVIISLRNYINTIVKVARRRQGKYLVTLSHSSVVYLDSDDELVRCYWTSPPWWHLSVNQLPFPAIFSRTVLLNSFSQHQWSAWLFFLYWAGFSYVASCTRSAHLAEFSRWTFI